MSSHIRANLWLLVFSIGLSSIAYPLIVLAFGQGLVPEKADGSLLYDKAGNVVGSSLIAQPFSGDEYFHPRPSAVGYNAASTAGSNWGANNYLLRDRVARALGPIVKYSDGEKKGQPVGPDIEAWFGRDEYQGARIGRPVGRCTLDVGHELGQSRSAQRGLRHRVARVASRPGEGLERCQSR